MGEMHFAWRTVDSNQGRMLLSGRAIGCEKAACKAFPTYLGVRG